jgi:hypothetical protein
MNRNFIEEETIESNHRFRIFDTGQHHSLSNSSNSILPIHHSFHLDDLMWWLCSLVAATTQIKQGGFNGKRP